MWRNTSGRMETIMIRFDRFTHDAQEIAQRAAGIMQRYSHNQIDTEHLLLALMEQPRGVVSQLLTFLKVDANALSERLDTILCTGPKGDLVEVGAGQISITARVARILELANEEANRLQDEHTSIEPLFCRERVVVKLNRKKVKNDRYKLLC